MNLRFVLLLKSPFALIFAVLCEGGHGWRAWKGVSWLEGLKVWSQTLRMMSVGK